MGDFVTATATATTTTAAASPAHRRDKLQPWSNFGNSSSPRRNLTNPFRPRRLLALWHVERTFLRYSSREYLARILHPKTCIIFFNFHLISAPFGVLLGTNRAIASHFGSPVGGPRGTFGALSWKPGLSFFALLVL